MTTMPQLRSLALALGLFCSLGAWSGTAGALDHDATLSVGNTSVAKPQTGSATLDFTVTRSGDTSFPVQADYVTADDTARAGTDYSARSGTVFLPAGATSATVSVPALPGSSTQPRDLRLGLTAAYAGLPAFDTNRSFATGGHPKVAALGDLNGDGRPDLAVANAGDWTVSGSLSVLLNTTASGSDSPRFVGRQDLAIGSFPQLVSRADVNGDGRPDLVIVTYYLVSVFLNTTATGAGALSFAPRQDFAAENISSAALGDVNGDGRVDLAVVAGSFEHRDTVSVWLNSTASGAGTVSFAAPQAFGTGRYPQSVALGDLNGDGRPDLAVTNTLDYTVSVLLNSTASAAEALAFTSHQDFATGGHGFAVALGDIDGDGRPDLAVASGSPYSDPVAILMNKTAKGADTPSFAGGHRVTTDGRPVFSAVLDDLNGDGRADLVTPNADADSVTVLLSNTPSGADTPSFSHGQDFGTGAYPRATALGDINNDGRLDMAVVNSDGDSVSVLLNTMPGEGSMSGFARRQLLATGSAPHSMALGDINGDGRPDAVATNSYEKTVLALVNTTTAGTDTASFALPQAFPTETAPGVVTLGDLNGDDRPDLVMTNLGSDSVSVWLNATAGGAAAISFPTRQDLVTGAAPDSLALGDLNGDGRPDLAVVKRNSNTVSLWLNTTASGAGTASFSTRQDLATGSAPESVALGDLNGDGRADLVVTNRSSHTVSVWLNTTMTGAATPGFATRQDFQTGYSPFDVVLGDLNDDGRMDLAVTNFSSGSVSVLLNTTATGAGTASFAARQNFLAGRAPNAMVLGDADGDGRPDLVVTANGYIVSVFRNTTPKGVATAGFATRQSFDAVYAYQNSPALGDINGDGRPDLVTAHGNEAYVSVRLGTRYRASVSGPAAVGTIFANASDSGNGGDTGGGAGQSGGGGGMGRELLLLLALSMGGMAQRIRRRPVAMSG